MTDKTYRLEPAGEGFVLVEKGTGHGKPAKHLRYSIEQEAESSIQAASCNEDLLRSTRRQQALYLVRDICRLFIKGDPDVSALLAARKSVEDLVTASIAEIRNQTGCALPVKNNTMEAS